MANAALTVYFPIAYTSAPRIVALCVSKFSSGSITANHYPHNVTSTAFEYVKVSSTLLVDWISVGY